MYRYDLLIVVVSVSNRPIQFTNAVVYL